MRGTISLLVSSWDGLKRSCTARYRRSRYMDWAAMRTEEGRRKLDSLIHSLPEVEWDVDAHTHWQVLEDSLHSKLAAAFPVQRRPSRSDIFSTTTWTFLEHWRRLRGHLDFCDLLCQQTFIRSALRAWADMVPSLSKCGTSSVFAPLVFFVYSVLCYVVSEQSREKCEKVQRRTKLPTLKGLGIT